MDQHDPTLSDDEDDYEYQLKRNKTQLVDAIDIKDLLTTNVATFEVNTNVESALEEQQKNYFANEDFLKSVNFDCLDPDSDEDDAPGDGPGKTPFDRIAMKMVNLTPDGKIKKRVKREGTGDVVPPESLIWMHYNLYLEYADEPFDSSYLRGRPTKVRLNNGQLIPGLEFGIATMKKTEVAQFLIHPDWAYGKFGVPPRIPAEAEILVHLELVQFIDNATAVEMGNLSKEEREKAGFDKIYKTAESWVLKANDLVNKKNYPASAQNYRKAIDLLEPARMENEEQEKKQQKLLCRSFINLSICLNKQSSVVSFRQSCIACQSALRINPVHPKAMYNYAVAQMELGSYNQAKKYAMRARKSNPHSIEINALLQKLDTKLKMYKCDSVAFAQKAFKFSGDKKELKVTEEIADSFMTETRAFLKEFFDDTTENTLTLPCAGFTKKEEKFLKEEAERLGMSCRLIENKSQMYIKK